MSQPDTIVLNNGGIRSFVAGAIAVREYGARGTVMLHFRGNDPGADAIVVRVRKQAEYLEMSHVVVLQMQELSKHRGMRGQDAETIEPLVRSRLLLAGLAEGIELKAERLIWPVQADLDFDLAAKVTEQTVLTRHIAELEHEQIPVAQTPLLELTDQQVVELGNQMDLPWELTWSCVADQAYACRACAGCKRRHAGFAATNTPDPCEQVLVH